MIYHSDRTRVCPYCNNEALEKHDVAFGEYWGATVEVEYQETCGVCGYKGHWAYGTYEMVERPRQEYLDE